jgi:hypothetical protein
MKNIDNKRHNIATPFHRNLPWGVGWVDPGAGRGMTQRAIATSVREGRWVGASLDPTSYEASLVKLRVISIHGRVVARHMMVAPGGLEAGGCVALVVPRGGRWFVQGRPADHLLSVPAGIAGHPIPRAP